jgi:hypothetical protein
VINPKFELDRLLETLRARGVSHITAARAVAEAEREINEILQERADEIMQQAIKYGVEKESPEFINELVLRPNDGMFTLETDSSRTDFSEPPFPMLPRLLANAKPMKDGSGVYKIVPVGKKGLKKPITSIVDAHKAVAAQRKADAAERYANVTKKVSENGGKVSFRTATSKQDASTQWVLPATDKDFTEELQSLNEEFKTSAEESILGIIREYEDRYS